MQYHGSRKSLNGTGFDYTKYNLRLGNILLLCSSKLTPHENAKQLFKQLKKTNNKQMSIISQ